MVIKDHINEVYLDGNYQKVLFSKILIHKDLKYQLLTKTK